MKERKISDQLYVYCEFLFMKIDIEAHNKLKRTSKQYKVPSKTHSNY
jgi:hypothetical protein